MLINITVNTKNPIEDKTVLAENKKITTVNRKQTRKYLFQKLYASTFSYVESSSFDESFFNEVHDFDMDVLYLDEMFDLVHKNEKTLIFIISELAPKFSIETMWMDYILPIYIWATEMLFLEEEIPAKVSLNEAVEIAKVYWDESTKRIVNGVMNKLFKDFESIKEKIAMQQPTSTFSVFAKN